MDSPHEVDETPVPETIMDIVNDVQEDFDPNSVLYTYGVEQVLSQRGKVQILFMFAHEAKSLIVVNIDRNGKKRFDLRAFATPFDPTQTVHVALEPFIAQLDSDVRVMTEEEITDIWAWLPAQIVNYFEADCESWFNIEDDPEEVPGTLGADEYCALARFGMYAQELSSEFLEDVLAV